MTRRRYRKTWRDWAAEALGTLLVLAVILGVLALSWWMRETLPCGMFPLAEAPVRCLPGATP